MSPPANTSSADGKPLPESAPAPRALDAATAIELMDNSTVLYKEIAQAYLLEIADLAQRMDGLLQQSSLEAATRTLHTFKGLSLTVGANLLSDICRQCELQLKLLLQRSAALDDSSRMAMTADLTSAIDETRQALESVLASLGQPATTDASTPTTAVDLPELLQDLQGLRNLLACSDLQALDRFDALLARHPAMREQLRTLGRAVKIFDFAQAVVQCDELTRYLGDTTKR